MSVCQTKHMNLFHVSSVLRVDLILQGSELKSWTATSVYLVPIFGYFLIYNIVHSMLTQGWAQVCFLTGESAAWKGCILTGNMYRWNFTWRKWKRGFSSSPTCRIWGTASRVFPFSSSCNILCAFEAGMKTDPKPSEMCQLKLLQRVSDFVSEWALQRLFVFTPVSIQNKLFSS